MRMFKALNRFWTASIARQLMLGIALVHALLMGIFIFDLVQRQQDFLVDQTRQHAQALAKTLAANGSSWMLASDIIGVEELIDSQSHYPGLRYAMLMDRRGKVLGYTDRHQVGRYADDEVSRRLIDAPAEPQLLIDRPLLVDVAEPVTAQGEHIGWARVGVSRNSIALSLGSVTRDGLLYALIAISVGLLFAWFMSRGLTSDIRRLVRLVKGVTAGARRLEVHIERGDEIGQLAKNIHHMIQTLADREHELSKVNTALQAGEERVRYALEGSEDGVWDWDFKTGQLYFSPGWKAILGYRDDEIRNHFREWEQRVHPDDREPTLKTLEAHLRDGSRSYEQVFRMRHKDGHWVWVLSRGAALRDAEGEAYRMVGTHMDMSEIKQLEHSLEQERERALVTLESIGDGVITTRADGRIEYMNPVAETLTGWDTPHAGNRPLEQVLNIVDEETGEPAENPARRCIEAGEVVASSGDLQLLSRDGRRIWVQASAAPIRDKEGQVAGVVLVFRDTTATREMQRQIEHQARHDELTKLWNRRAFEQRLTELHRRVESNDEQHVLLYLDLDQFKVVNDTVGHLAGDELLKQVSTLFQQHVRDSDMLARIGGDEFGVLLFGCSLEDAVNVAHKLREALVDFRFVWQNHSFQVGVSVGVAAINPTTLFSNPLSLADLACYSAKEQGRNRVHVYRPEDRELRQRHGEMQWVTRIKDALENDRLVLYGQRILPLGNKDAGTEFREVLVRMLDEDGEIIPPNMFIPAAERYGLMQQLDQRVLSMACDWLEAHPDLDCRLSINISGASLGSMDLLNHAIHRLTELPRGGTRVCFEITETAAIGNLRDALNFMSRLKKLGVRFSLDDFGSGLSSFAYLKTLPVSYLKIDGSFVRDMVDDPLDAAMVEAIVHISRQMGLETIAEFVENEATMDMLRKLGADYVQGYAIERPCPLSGASLDQSATGT